MEHIVENNGARLAATSAGNGPELLVLLHGGPGLNRGYLLDLLGLARDDLQVVAYDQRRVSGPELLDTLVDDLDAVIRHFGAERAHLLGHSFGGVTMALYARRHPGRIASAILIDPGPLTRRAWRAAEAALMARIEELTKLGIIDTSKASDATAWIRAVLPAYFADPRHPAAAQADGLTYDSDVFAAASQLLGDHDLRDSFAGLTAPTLILGSPTPFPGMADEFAEAIPHATAVTVTGHLPWLEDSERCMSVLREFLQ